MAKYQKQGSPARRKRRVFDVVQPTLNDGRSYVDELARSQVQTGLQRALEDERDEMVGRSWHDHHQDGMPLQYRNGYGRPPCLTCGCGQIALEMPRLREAYDSKIVAKYERLTPALQELIPQLYLHGLATGQEMEIAYDRLAKAMRSGDSKKLAEVRTIIDLVHRKKDFVHSIPVWPWNPGTFTALDSAIILPIILGILSRIMQRVLEL
jgi:hypothetical protein